MKDKNIFNITSIEALTIVFITLKLCKVISWNWWFVFSPIWGMIAIATIIGIITSIRKK